MEPACAVLEISPSTYYAAKKRQESPSARAERDEELKKAIMQAREKKGRKLYGAKKMWRELNRDGDRGRAVHGRAADALDGPRRPAGQEEEAADHRAWPGWPGETV